MFNTLKSGASIYIYKTIATLLLFLSHDPRFPSLAIPFDDTRVKETSSS